MKINHEARRAAKKFFALCRLPGGGVDETRLRAVLAAVQAKRPRNAAGILTRLHKLVALEINETTVTVESSEALSSDVQSTITTKLKNTFGPATNIGFSSRPELIGGLRIRKGSMVWDGTIKGRLDELRKAF